ncbi:MAG: exodeoxyribonuclease VII large subunit, partial [Chloroflexi bacterium]|nr:exodeoxyribonuclease VII large subunit [Chloroflexota bacterium]
MRVYSVSQVTSYLREVLEGDPLLRDLWVSGEISNVNRSPAGHLYFTLKDERSELQCVFFRNEQNGASVADGMAALVGGRLSLYPQRGQLQIYVRAVLPEGLGRLQLEFEQLKARLQAEGLFDPSRKRPLPPFPRRIGVATSTAGAVLHDIIHVLGRRYPLVELVVAATPVQGDEAAPGIVTALSRLNA